MAGGDLAVLSRGTRDLAGPGDQGTRRLKDGLTWSEEQLWGLLSVCTPCEEA